MFVRKREREKTIRFVFSSHSTMMIVDSMLMKSFQFIEKVFDEWKPLSSQYVCSCGFQILEMKNDAGAILNTAMIYVIIKICSNKAFRHAEPAIRFTIALNAMKKSCRAIFGDIFQRNLTQTFEV